MALRQHSVLQPGPSTNIGAWRFSPRRRRRGKQIWKGVSHRFSEVAPAPEEDMHRTSETPAASSYTGDGVSKRCCGEAAAEYDMVLIRTA